MGHALNVPARRSGFFNEKDGANNFRNVNDNGDDNNDNASNANGVVPGFHVESTMTDRVTTR